MGYRDRIREQVVARGIEALLHFTPLPNLRRIVESGLLSRDHVQEQGGFAYTSIDARLDGNNSAISLSVSASNHRMLTSKRSEERRVGKACVSTCRSRGSRYP